MTDTLSLFDVNAPPRARRTDDKACHDAAARVRVGQYDAAIFNLLNSYRRLTKNQICSHLKLEDPRAWSTVSARLSALRRVGRLEWCGHVSGDGNLYRLATEQVDTQGRL